MFIRTIKEKKKSDQSRKMMHIFQIMVMTMMIMFGGDDEGFSPWLLNLTAPGRKPLAQALDGRAGRKRTTASLRISGNLSLSLRGLLSWRSQPYHSRQNISFTWGRTTA